jgi:hypothetical protein
VLFTCTEKSLLPISLDKEGKKMLEQTTGENSDCKAVSRGTRGKNFGTPKVPLKYVQNREWVYVLGRKLRFFQVITIRI